MYIQRLRDLREDSDLSQSKVAKILFVGQSAYSRYEREYYSIPVAHLVKLADFYKTSTDYLLGRTTVRAPYGKPTAK